MCHLELYKYQKHKPVSTYALRVHLMMKEREKKIFFPKRSSIAKVFGSHTNKRKCNAQTKPGERNEKSQKTKGMAK